MGGFGCVRKGLRDPTLYSQGPVDVLGASKPSPIMKYIRNLATNPQPSFIGIYILIARLTFKKSIPPKTTYVRYRCS